MGFWQKKIEEQPKKSSPKGREHIRLIEMRGHNETKGGVMESNGFLDCKGLLIYNEETKVTYGFHIIADRFSKEQRQKLQDISNIGGKKHAVFFHGTYRSMPYKEEIQSLSSELSSFIPENLTIRNTMIVTEIPHNYEDNPYAQWGFLYNAGTGEMMITEKPNPYSGVLDQYIHFYEPFKGIVIPPEEAKAAGNIHHDGGSGIRTQW